MGYYVVDGVFKGKNARVPLSDIRSVKVTTTISGNFLWVTEVIFFALFILLMLTYCAVNMDESSPYFPHRGLFIYSAFIPLVLSGALNWFRRTFSTKLQIKTSQQTIVVDAGEKACLEMEAEILKNL